MTIKQITYLISATTKEFNTTEDTTTDQYYDYSTKIEYMKAQYNRAEDTTNHYYYDYSTAEETMTEKDTAMTSHAAWVSRETATGGLTNITVLFSLTSCRVSLNFSSDSLHFGMAIKRPTKTSLTKIKRLSPNIPATPRNRKTSPCTVL